MKLPSIIDIYSKLQRSRAVRNRIYNVAMFHTGRCGSTVLGDMLNQHNDIQWASEIFAEKNFGNLINENFTAEQLLESKMWQNNKKIFGFETKYLYSQHLNKEVINLSLSDYFDLLKSMGFNKFIVLHRKNYLRRVVSVQSAVNSKYWHTTKDVSKINRVNININSFQTGIKTQSILSLFYDIDKSYNELNQLLSDTDYLSLTYEADVLGDPFVGHDKICKFLDIESSHPSIKFKKTNPFNLQQMVINFNEIKSSLKNTDYEWMLYD